MQGVLGCQEAPPGKAAYIKPEAYIYRSTIAVEAECSRIRQQNNFWIEPSISGFTQCEFGSNPGKSIIYFKSSACRIIRWQQGLVHRQENAVFNRILNERLNLSNSKKNAHRKIYYQCNQGGIGTHAQWFAPEIFP